MTQTAVEWLIDALENPHKNINWEDTKQEAKEMEKQQRKDDYLAGLNAKDDIDYYNETYGSKGSDDHIVDTNQMVSSQTEISDEEIEKIVDNQFGNIHSTYDEGIIYGMKLYREQLKQKL